jgi:N-acetylglucosaminyl-diphospho-decaprenol L-rhamnosyltransferase
LKLAIVIVHYNSSADLDRCLESIVACAPRQEHQVIIVDNASRDDGLETVHRRYPDFTWIFSEENTGYSRGCNLGMAQVDAEYYLILNPDIVVQPGALDSLLEFADAHPRAGMVGPQLLNEDGSVQASCRRFYTFTTLLMRRTLLGKIFPNSESVRLHLMKDFDHRSSRPVDWVLGGCLLVRRTAMDRTGPMDERFFLYFEDVDWCYRMWQAGFEVLYSPDARFMHRHRRESAKGTFNRTFWMHLGSLISFYEKWGILVWLLKKWRDPLMLFSLWMADLLGVTMAFGLAYLLRGALDRAMPGVFAEPLYPFGEYLPVLGFSLLLATMTFFMTGRYRSGQGRSARSTGEQLKQIGALAVLLMATTYLGHLEVVSRAVLLLFIPLLAVAVVSGERLFRAALARLEKGRLSLERTLVVGGAQELRSWLSGAPGLKESLLDQGVDLAGYVAEPATDGVGLPPLGGGVIPWLGRPADLLEVVKRYRISQVVFRERPGSDEDHWRLLAGLRGLRVRMRWQIPDVWLLEAPVHGESFGPAASAVTSQQSRVVAAALLRRLLSLAGGLLLLLLGSLPWLWQKLFSVRQGKARVERVEVRDFWGNRVQLVLALDRQGRTRSLPWQWRLAGPLLTGRLGLSGSSATLGDRPAIPDGLADGASLWRLNPAAPGLTGCWAAGAEGSEARWWRMGKQLWLDPGGFGEQPAARDRD